MSEIVYTAKNAAGREIHVSSRRADIRHMVFIRDADGDWTYQLSAGKSQRRILAGLLRSHPNTEIRIVEAFRVTPVEHAVSVETIPGRYPYRPVCSCGQSFRGYVAHHAARDMADAHAQENAA